MVGVDEAGRGCIVGPMVVAGVALTSKAVPLLKAVGVKDSKRLSKSRREKLFPLIAENALAISLVKVSPEEIDTRNLNDLTYEAVLKVIRSLSYLSPGVITVDKVGREEVVVREIESMGASPRVEHNADVLYVEASAASIVAKVIRDEQVEAIRREYGDMGSGYPSDPKTRLWISSLSEAPPFLRRSWRTLQIIAPQLYVGKPLGD